MPAPCIPKDLQDGKQVLAETSKTHMEVHLERVGQGRPAYKDGWEEFIDMGAFFLDLGFNILAKTPGSSHNTLLA